MLDLMNNNNKICQIFTPDFNVKFEHGIIILLFFKIFVGGSHYFLCVYVQTKHNA